MSKPLKLPLIKENSNVHIVHLLETSATFRSMIEQLKSYPFDDLSAYSTQVFIDEHKYPTIDIIFKKGTKYRIDTWIYKVFKSIHLNSIKTQKSDGYHTTLTTHEYNTKKFSLRTHYLSSHYSGSIDEYVKQLDLTSKVTTLWSLLRIN